MATHCWIARYDATTGYTGIYCHFDGNPEYSGAILQDYYTNNAAVQHLVDRGNISALYTPDGLDTDGLMHEWFAFGEPATTHHTLSEVIAHARKVKGRFEDRGCAFLYIWDAQQCTWTCWDLRDTPPRRCAVKDAYMTLE